MLDLNPQLVCNIILRAREFQSKEEVVIPDVPESPAEDWARQALADHAGDKTLLEVKALIEDLEPDQQAELVALMLLGKGDYTVSEWVLAKEEAREDARKRTAEYLFAHPLVADFLQEGLGLMGYSCDI